jgi:beta-lactamase regulating signal transducer with metallopeptidase domain
MIATQFTLLTTILTASLIATALNLCLSKSKYELSFSPKLLLAALLIPFVRVMLPIEFSFTKKIHSHKVIPFMYDTLKMQIVAGVTISQVLLFVWLSGAVFSFAIKAIQYCKVSRCFRHQPNCADSETKEFISDSLRLANVKKRYIKLVRSQFIREPIIYGIWNPVIVMPEKVFADKTFLYDVLAHEINHYAHGDLLFKWILELASSFYWFLLPVQKLKKHIYTIMEIHADYYAVNQKDNLGKASYLQKLLTMHMEKQKSSTRDAFAITSFSYGDRKSLVRRFNAINSAGEIKAKKAKKSLILLAVLLLVIGLSYSFVVQPYALRDNAKDTFALSDGGYYLKCIDGGSYGLYLNEEYICIVDTLNGELRDLPIVND